MKKMLLTLKLEMLFKAKLLKATLTLLKIEQTSAAEPQAGSLALPGSVWLNGD